MNNDKILSGKKISDIILSEIKLDIQNITSRKPCLAVVLVGDDPASQVYVKNKKAACAKVGITSIEHLLGKNVTEDELLKLVQNLNNDSSIDGILVQLPLPSHLDSKIVIDTILPNKDVDGFNRYNMGSLTLNDPQICPCTPHGVMYMLDSLNINYHGKNAVIIGTSNIVGRPMALELLNRGATVTICNSKTQNLSSITASADILIVAVGRPNMVKSNWVKPDSIIIDIGINRLQNGTLCGDVDFDDVVNKVQYITPVPGGVGPMTIAMLIQNTLRCYQLNQRNLK
jgi:methylenetetrahydrofolate dehydrogenase (NADP+)/methenyltetrahydrofolate cyclohydrolase